MKSILQLKMAFHKITLVIGLIEGGASMTIRIENMKEEHWEEVSCIYRQGIASGQATFQRECPSYEEWDANHLVQCRYVALEGEKVVGFVAISPTSKRAVYKGVVELSIYVDEAYRGKGIGSRLMSRLCEESEEAGFWTLYAAIIAENKASIALHKKWGFREIGYREKIAKDKDGIWRNMILMERRSSKIY